MHGTVTLLDGAMGTLLWERTQSELPAWRYNIEAPDTVRELHAEYVAAGSGIIYANTFCANAASLKGSPYSVDEVVRAGVRIAKEAAGKRARVALSIGPLTGLLKPFGEISAEEAAALYKEQIGAGMLEKPDLIVLETFMDIAMLKIALDEAERHGAPVFCTMSFTKFGKTIMGNSPKHMAEALKGRRVEAIGLNCSLAPEVTLPFMREFREHSGLPLIFKPNAGLPTENGAEVDADAFAAAVLPARDMGVSYLGGCCGSSPMYIKRLADALK